MGNDNLLNKRDYEPLSILKIGIPKEVYYSAKEKKDLYESVKQQVGKNYLPILIPDDVKLEIISE